MKRYNYSFIIPHHNSPELLNRCLESIPQRDDIQIIVVDDNSDADKKPSSNRVGMIVINIQKNESKWAGHARNIGLKYAQGKWILFADSDDFYVDGFVEILDKYVGISEDVLYYNVDSVNSDDYKPAMRTKFISKIMNDYDKGLTSLDEVKYKCRAPWNKMVKRSFIEEHAIVFEEIRKGNDIQYSFEVGYFAKEVRVIQDVVYVCTYRPNSMTFERRPVESYLQSFANYYKIRSFYNWIGKRFWILRHPLFQIALILRSGSFLFCSKVFREYISNLRLLKESRNLYVNNIMAKQK